MSSRPTISRRNFLKATGLVTTGVVSGTIATKLPFISRVTAQSDDQPDLEVVLRAVVDQVSLLPGSDTTVWMYQGEVVQGAADALQAMPNSYMGPTIRVTQGQHVRIHFVNDLPESSIVHWHGLLLPEAMDAHPRYAIAPGQSYIYDFEVTNRAGTYWYHPHPHGATATQVYSGLAGLFIVTRDDEGGAALPDGAYDVPLVLQDRSFDADNQLVYITGGMMTQMMTQMMGFLGDRIMVNGKPDFAMDVERRAYRLRLLNASSFRIYKLAWDDGTPLTVIGTDGGLLAEPVMRDYVTLSPGERIELWADFSAWDVGSQLRLTSLPFDGIEMGGTAMGGMEMPDNTTLPHGSQYNILTVNVTAEATETVPLPETLSVIRRESIADASNTTDPRRFEIAMLDETWMINGRTFEMNAVADDEIVQADTLEVWEFVNVVNGGDSGNDITSVSEDQMAHPMHIHGVQFQVLDRHVGAAYREGWNSVSAGYVDEGWKDTVLLMPGESVRVLMRFGNEPGLYVFHCHNLEHEDLGLMRNYQLE